jgi:predicted amidohydrolase YtcJ
MKWSLLNALAILTISCSQKETADLFIHNAKIYTIDSSFSIAESMVVKDGKILAVGKTVDLSSQFEAKNKIDAEGKFIYPGFIDAHCHFYRYALGLNTVDLTGTHSWQEVLDKLQTFAKENPEGWLIGRGWDQNDWDVKSFPTKEKLDELFPRRAVVLTRIDGHAAIANQHALELSGIHAGDKLTGGEVEVRNGKLTGILIDNAADKVYKEIPSAGSKQIAEALMQAQRNCFAQGLTTVDDCGVDFPEALFMDSLQKAESLKMRVFAMLSDTKKNYEYLFSKGAIKTDRLNISSFKVYADGALGSRGACLLRPYEDKKDHYGFLLSDVRHFDSVARVIEESGFQMCTHAIGDSGNRAILKIYAKHLKQGNNRRWRIEHAQVINQDDFALFGKYNIIPSVQPTHATSDMYWAGERLGKQREKGAYAFRQLLEQNGWLPLGTDFPVEDISPFKTFYAAVARQDSKGWPEGGYQMENALTREHALRGMTIWAAKSNFEEKEKGSLEAGKFADFILLDTDLMTAPPERILHTQVLATYINGELVFKLK